ncbi:related to salicylate 1-monooxygenase [Phialocephala subalpina]|uniref:Related to salicylate 1-monooxygenase n=1 Tax=Phialocephala subalpina TaxID=576137 RepID=A0A1L7X4L0_9HELO|nr:related to salicylate 1-monooxygenase [Phialocephala subalpina]
MPEPSTKKPFTIAIIGGGLAGLLLAIGLTTRGVPVHIYEAAPAFAETSAGIGFGPNAVRAMTMLDPRIRIAYDKLKTENRWEGKRNTWFDFRLGWGEVPEFVAELKMDGNEGGGNVLRARFMEALVALLPEGCAGFGKILTELEECKNHVKLTFSDKTTELADAVVGCDGIRSVVRELLLGKDDQASRAIFSGMYCYRGLLDMQAAIDAVGGELSLNSQVYMGKDGDVVTYPIEQGSVLNVVAFQKHKDNDWKYSKWVADSSHEDLMKDFEEFGEVPKKILKLLDKTEIWALFDMPNAARYSSKLVALLGDAAHASTSHAGAGAGMAVEDALVLSELISDARVNIILDLPAVFAVYDLARRPRTQKLVQYSRESGMLFQLRKPGAGGDIEKIKVELKDRQKWIWDIDIEEHLKDAEAGLGLSLRKSSE